jgi:NAD(P)-dependent dehydrogenase (short-subunit alcohol dehydrogenase family)
VLTGRVAAVTGSGRGIGRAEALRLAAYGARVVVNDLGVATDGSETGETPAEEVAAEIRAAGGEAVADRSDIATIDGGEAVVQRALDEWGRLDVVVNNAGFGRPRMAFNLSPEEWDDVVRVHLRGAFAVTSPACRWWRSEAKAGREQSGRVINTSTGLLLYGGAGQSNYVAAKAGVLAFTEALATEMAPYGVTANCIMPSAADFDPTDPVHVAEMICYLASAGSGWCNGQTFQVRGGIVEHVQTFVVDRMAERSDAGWTAPDLVGELPRLFGAGARAADPPPKEWQDQYRAKGGASTAPSS